MEFKKIEPLFSFLKKLYPAYIVILVLALFTGIYEYYSFNNLPEGYNPNEDLLPSDVVTMIIGVAQVVVTLLLLINFFRFIYRLSKNLQNKYNISLKVSPGWSVGYFFIPFANLFKPYQTIKELFQQSVKDSSIDESLLKVWWACWIISNIIGRFVLKNAIKNWGNATDTTQTIIYLISDSFDLLLYILEFNLVKKIAVAYMNNYENTETSV